MSQEPFRFLNGAHIGSDGRAISYLHCAVHPCTDKIRWPDGSEECMMCVADRQIALMSEAHRKNIGFNMPYIKDWMPLPTPQEGETP